MSSSWTYSTLIRASQNCERIRQRINRRSGELMEAALELTSTFKPRHHDLPWPKRSQFNSMHDNIEDIIEDLYGTLNHGCKGPHDYEPGRPEAVVILTHMLELYDTVSNLQDELLDEAYRMMQARRPDSWSSYLVGLLTGKYVVTDAATLAALNKWNINEEDYTAILDKIESCLADTAALTIQTPAQLVGGGENRKSVRWARKRKRAAALRKDGE